MKLHQYLMRVFNCLALGSKTLFCLFLPLSPFAVRGSGSKISIMCLLICCRSAVAERFPHRETHQHQVQSLAPSQKLPRRRTAAGPPQKKKRRRRPHWFGNGRKALCFLLICTFGFGTVQHCEQPRGQGGTRPMTGELIGFRDPIGGEPLPASSRVKLVVPRRAAAPAAGAALVALCPRQPPPPPTSARRGEQPRIQEAARH